MPAGNGDVPNGPSPTRPSRAACQSCKGERLEDRYITMNCIEFEEQMFAFLDEELDEARRAAMRKHLDGCVCCTVDMEAERDITRRLKAKWLDDEVESALATLEPVDRRMIFLTSILDMGYEDVAADLKWTVEAVESGMVRARCALRSRLNGPVVPNRKPENSHDVQ